MINGVGGINPSRVDVRELRNTQDGRGYALDATESYGFQKGDFFIGRAYWLTPKKELLVVDHARRPDPGRVEMRWHSPAKIHARKRTARIQGKQESLNLAFGSTVPASLHPFLLPVLDPDMPYTSLRWTTECRAPEDLWLYTLISPHPIGTPISHQIQGNNLEISWNSGTQKLIWTPDLQLAE